MTRQQEILHYYLSILDANYNIQIPAMSLPFIKNAMQKYAEEYHQSELLKLNKSDVISSVCKRCKSTEIKRTPVTYDCYECGCTWQTDL